MNMHDIFMLFYLGLQNFENFIFSGATFLCLFLFFRSDEQFFLFIKSWTSKSQQKVHMLYSQALSIKMNMHDAPNFVHVCV